MKKIAILMTLAALLLVATGASAYDHVCYADCWRACTESGASSSQCGYSCKQQCGAY
ncbi:hypothetical protein [Desulfotalea psychrophila]|uniref:hypothetical protein n=1 Tax=Desulfotalea psychrophila TaxID=84980 RepID=UPI000319DD6F|nr:hypothetical protein [Desulfotalea psychrophila]